MHLGIRSHLPTRGVSGQHIAVGEVAVLEMEFQVLVRKIKQEAERIKSFELVPADGSLVPSYTAGSNITLLLEKDLARTYSLIDTGVEPDALRIAVLDQHNGRGGSRFMHENVNVGDTLTVKGIANCFSAAKAASNHILIAGGIGITPILSLAKFFAGSSSKFKVHYSAQSRGRAAFIDQIVSSSSFYNNVEFYFSDEGKRIDIKNLLSKYVEGTAVYCCGPSGLMSAVTSLASHWPEGALRLDSFAPLDEDRTSDVFKVQIASTGQTFDVPPCQTILSVLRGKGFDLGSQCEQGVCGACLTPVLKGIPEHRDRVLSENERRANDLMTICCSRSLSGLLVLDI